jgi:hypothetical protein
MHELQDVGQLKIVFPNTPLSTTRSFLRANRDTSLRFMCGFTQGLQRLRTDREFSMKVLAKYTKVTDSETLPSCSKPTACATAATGFLCAAGKHRRSRRTPEKSARGKAADFIDNSLLQELDKSGWFRVRK